MSVKAFFDDATKRRTTEAIRRVEERTAAEVVVTVRRESGYYRYADYLFGFAVALATLIALLFLPQEFHLATFPVDVLVGFVAGSAVSAWTPPLRRVLTGPKRQRRFVENAAKAAFVELGISKTAGRTGVLVYVSLFERRVEVVRDIGVAPAVLGPEWRNVLAELESAVRGRPDADRFVAALERLGGPLGVLLPRGEDDVNELSDEVQTA
jgi:putative membrane protein